MSYLLNMNATFKFKVAFTSNIAHAIYEVSWKFKERFNPKLNEFINVIKFNKIAQFEEESVNKSVGRLKVETT